MRFSLALLQQAKQATTTASHDAALFERLPETLQRFFERYPPAPFKQYATKPTLTTAEDANPFLANKHPVTQKYHQPKYSLRRQSELWKLAHHFGVADCLPQLQGDKSFYQEKYDANEFMRGQLRPKGHKYDKTKQQRRDKIQAAVEQADEKIIAVKGNKYKRLLERRAKKSTTWI
ncbi:CYFA0S07e03224g1_1 [Cyberlindnera fabianii]|uniref:CYFA0S07e03224g1_1 n=1 Tax=Cyberlindnera fabianii TaxID=36022 RepID=A0A061AVG0_CYBFA|nr:CYFA0S07e03224g1_1 [Cyberlindnera fabianii]